MKTTSSVAPPKWSQRRQVIRHPALVPVVWCEWSMEWLVHWFGRWALVDFLEYAGRFSVVVAVVFYLIGHGDRLKEKHYQAWQVINAAQGKPGTGGRIDALQDLNGDRVSLAGVDLSGGARLRRIRLPGADLNEAIFVDAVMDSANLRGASLQATRFVGADLRRADLRDVDLTGARLDRANLYGAQLQRAAIVAGASLRGCILDKADFSETSVWEADFTDASLNQANLELALFLTPQQILSASDWRGAHLPESLRAYQLTENATPQDVVDLKARMGLKRDP